MVSLDEQIGAVEACLSVAELAECLHGIAQNYGFDSFSFVDVAEPEKCAPFFLTTAEQKWVDDYKSNDFMNSDPMIPIVQAL